MPRLQRSTSGPRVRKDFLKAELDAGFALLRLAEAQSASGVTGDAHQSLKEAGAAHSEGQRRLLLLADADVAGMQAQLQKLRKAIEKVRLRLDRAADAAPRRRTRKVVRMPSRPRKGAQ